MREEDINEILKSTEYKIKGLKKYKAMIEQKEEERNLLKVEVKVIIEGLRSCLDYLAIDIYEVVENKKYNPRKDKVYFPYETNKKKFKKRVEAGPLKRLEEKNKKVYKYIKEVQVFSCKDRWLTNLCNLANFNKHDKLSPQKREDNKILKVGGVNIVSGLQNITNLKMTGCTFNGKKQEKDITIKNGEVVEGGNDFEIINFSKFKFKNPDIDIIEFLEKAYEETSLLKVKIYEELKK